MRKYILGLFLFVVVALSAQVPEGYYSSIDGKKDWELKTTLYHVLKGQTVLKYNDLWMYFRTTDVRDDGLSVWDMYSGGDIRFDANNKRPGDLQKEHLVPKSWWAPSKESEKYEAYSDLHHLYPSDRKANNAKANYILGEVRSSRFDNGVSKVGRNTYNHSQAPKAMAFEPADEYKGDFARAYFYVVTRYEDYADLWRTDALYVFNQETYPVLQPWAAEMLLKWHRQDPVSEKEIYRNNEVYFLQNNRNPFVDIPGLAEYIWGDSIGYTYNLPAGLNILNPRLINPPHLSEINFGEVRKNTEVVQKVTLKGIGLKGVVKLRIEKGNKTMFVLSDEAIPAEKINAGYPVEVTYSPNRNGSHTSRLVIRVEGADDHIIHLKGNAK